MEKSPPAWFEIRNLEVHFPGRRTSWFASAPPIRAVDGVSLKLERGKTLALVGESGCGKSTTARAALRLAPIAGGEIWFEGTKISVLSEHAMRPFRRRLQMIFQDPFSSLDPRMTIGQAIQEPLDVFGEGDRRRRRLEVLRMLDLVGLPLESLNRYPHEFSGGQRQRVGIARALALRPQLVFCDEPLSALDVSIQAQIVNLLQDLKARLQLSYVFISHDLAVVRLMADRVAVMYRGRVVEEAGADELYAKPLHPYTQALLSAVPEPDPDSTRAPIVLEGEPSSPDQLVTCCVFADRCPLVLDRCRKEVPALETIGGRQVACFRPGDLIVPLGLKPPAASESLAKPAQASTAPPAAAVSSTSAPPPSPAKPAPASPPPPAKNAPGKPNPKPQAKPQTGSHKKKKRR